MTDSSWTRRGVLGATASAVTASLAGCSILGRGGDSAGAGGFDPDSAGSFEQFQVDAANSGYVPQGSVGESPEREWKFTRGSPGPAYGIGNPAVADGTAYVTEKRPDTEGFGTTLYAIDLADGAVEWSRSVQLQTHSQVSVANGLVIGQGGNVIAFDPADGGKQWETRGESNFQWPLAMDGTTAYGVSISYRESRLVGLNLDDGSERWSVTGGAFERAPALGDDRLYVGGDDLHACTTDGTERWTAGLDHSVAAAPTVGDGQVFAVGSDRTVSALGTDGDVNWQTTVERSPRSRGFGPISTSPATDGERLYVHFGGRLHVLDVSDGSEVWHVDVGLGNPPVVTENSVVLAFLDELRCLDTATGELRWSYHTTAETGSETVPAVLDGGVVFPSAGLHLVTF